MFCNCFHLWSQFWKDSWRSLSRRPFSPPTQKVYFFSLLSWKECSFSFNSMVFQSQCCCRTKPYCSFWELSVRKSSGWMVPFLYCCPTLIKVEWYLSFFFFHLWDRNNSSFLILWRSTLENGFHLFFWFKNVLVIYTPGIFH